MYPDWVRKVRDDCQAAGVPFFFKSWGEWAPQISMVPDLSKIAMVDGLAMERIGKKAAGHLLDGREWRELPGVKG